MHGKSKIDICYLSFITKDIFILKLLICETLFIKCSKRLLVWMVNVVRDFKLKKCSPVFYEGPCVTAFTYRCKVFQGTAFWSPFRARTARKLSSSETSLCREEAGRLVREEKKKCAGEDMAGRENKSGLFTSSHCSRRFLFFSHCYFLLEYQAGALRRREVLKTESQYKQNAFLVNHFRIEWKIKLLSVQS